jgi:hypothetical protein
VLLREQSDGEAACFDWAEMTVTDFAARERLIAQELRGL